MYVSFITFQVAQPEDQQKSSSLTDVKQKLWFMEIAGYRGHGATVWWINPLTTYVNAATDHLRSPNREPSARNKIFPVDYHNYAGARASEMKCRRTSRLTAWRLGQLLVNLLPDKEEGWGAGRYGTDLMKLHDGRKEPRWNERQPSAGVSSLF